MMPATRPARRTSHGATRRQQRIRRAALASITAAAISTLSTLGIAPAHAEPSSTPTRVRLEFIRGPGAEHCPDEQFLRAETVRRMGGVDPYDAEAPLTMTASIERHRDELAASMFLRDSNGRGLWADGFSSRKDCKRLVAAMALSIAVLLDDTAELPAAPASPAAPPEPAQPSEQALPPEEPCSPDRPCPPQPVPAPAPAPPSRKTPPVRAPTRSSAPALAAERFRWVAGLDAVVGLGLTPGVSVGPALSIGGRWPAWSVALEVRGLSSLSAEVEEVPMAASFFMTNAALCLHRHALFACGTLELGMLRAAPEVPLGAASFMNFGVGLGGRLGIDWPFSTSLSARGYLDVAQVLTGVAIGRRPNLQRPGSALWSSPDVAGTLGLGVAASL
ncbi:hypothetical protein [Sorangium sp. So ce388]|uniref:hypothetical protein n=1 Tax=Sorangium sp. So ce388 TaxID=3133309 RepID=UPI003F5B1DF9